MTESLYVANFETPIGPMQAIASDSALCALEFVKPDRQKLLEARLTRWFSAARRHIDQNDILEAAGEWLERFFEGDFEGLPRIALDPRGTDFEKRVWREMQKITAGETMTYRNLAIEVGNPNGSRAVGNASRRNPLALMIPCHRVIGSNGSLTGYGGGLKQKEWLLQHESTAAPVASSSNRGLLKYA